MGVGVSGNRNTITKIIAENVFINQSVNGEESNEAVTSPEVRSISFRGEESVFVGRQEYIDKIRDYLTTPGSRRLVSIIGPGGSGKSQLAFKAIHQYYEKDRIFDVVIPIYFDSGIMMFDEFLIEVSRKLFLNQEQKSKLQSVDTEERINIIRNELLQKTRPLVYVDNFETVSYIINNFNSAEKDQPRDLETAQQIKNFLKNDLTENTSVLLTSRERNNLGGIEKRIDLEGLNKNESNQLFSILVTEDYLKNPSSDRIKQKINNLLESTGGHPLSIEIRASNITSIEELEQISNTLRDKINPDEPIKRLQSLKTCFDYTISKLDSNLKHILQKLTFFKSPFPISAATEIFNAKKEDITNLFSRSLLSRIESDNIYGKIEKPEYWLYNFHPAIRNYLEVEVTQKEGSSIEKEYGIRFSEYYYDLIIKTNDSFGQENRKSSLARFNIIFQGESNDFDRAIEMAEMEDRELGADIQREIGSNLLSIGMFSKSLQYFERRLQTNIELDRMEEIAWDYYSIGSALKGIGKFEEALNYNKKSLQTFENLNYKKEMAWSYSGIALTLLDMGRYKEALDYHSKCLVISEELLTPEETQKDYVNHAAILAAIGNNDEALDYCNKALVIAERVKNRNVKADAYVVMSGVLQKTNKNTEALDYCNKALAIHEELNVRRAMASDYYNIGIILSKMSKYSEAVEFHKKSKDIFEELNDRLRTATVYSDLGLSLEGAGNNAEAFKYYEKALAIHEELNEKLAMANDYSNMGIASMGLALGNLDEIDKTIVYFDKALKIDPNLVTALENKGIALEKLGKLEEALSYYDRILNINPDDSNVLNAKAWNLAMRDQYGEGLAWIDKSIKIGPKNVNALHTKGYILHNIGKYEESIKSFEQALEFDSSFAIAWYDKARSYTKIKDIDNAFRDLKKAVQFGGQEYITKAKTDKDFDDIRNDSRFRELIGNS